MKKIALLILFITSLMNKAQSYSFDYTLKIKGVDKESEESIGNSLLLMINSQNPDYEINIQDNIGGTLFNYNQSTIYNFHIQKKTHEYIFTKSLKYPIVEEITIDHIDVEKIEENKYLLKTFKSPKSKIPDVKITITLKPADSDLIRFYHLDFNHRIQTKLTNALKNKLDGKTNYFISDYEIKDNKGFNAHYKIEKIEKINLDVTNPLE